jgi:hypothetical protein
VKTLEIAVTPELILQLDQVLAMGGSVSNGIRRRRKDFEVLTLMVSSEAEIATPIDLLSAIPYIRRDRAGGGTAILAANQEWLLDWMMPFLSRTSSNIVLFENSSLGPGDSRLNGIRELVISNDEVFTVARSIDLRDAGEILRLIELAMSHSLAAIECESPTTQVLSNTRAAIDKLIDSARAIYILVLSLIHN